MTNENGALSIDFLIGFTIFLLGFIWVVSMIPGLLIGLQAYTIDYDAVAYRTSVVLVEDPGEPALPIAPHPWEYLTDKRDVVRFGLALSKETPNILSQDKVNRFFCATAFAYPVDYQNKTIFGDYPYRFNISLLETGSNKTLSVGDVMSPNSSYGTIRRLVKIKGSSYAMINSTNYTSGGNDTTQHSFIILVNQNELLLGQVRDPIYQINPAQENIVINITNINSTLGSLEPCFSINLSRITVSSQDPNTGTFYTIGYLDNPIVDGIQYNQSSTPPYGVSSNISMILDPNFIPWSNYKQVYITLPFNLIPNSTQCPSYNFTASPGSRFLNNTFTSPFGYDYNVTNVTQADLRDAVLEVDIGSGYRTATEILIAGLKAKFTGVFIGGTSVQFTDQSTPINPPGNPTSWDWDFGDGTPHGTTNIIPPHTYTESGDWHVTLTVTNNTGGSDTSAPQIFRIRNITATAGAGGNITPPGRVQLAYGATQVYTITNNTGYHVADVLVDGSSVGAVPTYTFNNVVTNHTITASFAITNYTITASAGAGGTISPSGSVNVNESASQTFTITKNTGYHIVDVLVDGVSVGTNSTYTFTNVQANHTISATFAANAPVVMYYEGFESGSTGWVLTGASRQNGVVPKNQTWSMRLRNTNSMYRPTSTAGYSSIVVQFAWAATTNAAGENAYAEYSTNGGFTWNTISQINGPVTQPTLSIFTSPALPAAADHNANFQLRFRITGSSNSDLLYVDDVRVTGIPD